MADVIVIDDDERESAEASLRRLFPDICSTYLAAELAEYGNNIELVTGSILDRLDSGIEYPKQSKGSKRKRDDHESQVADGELDADVDGDLWEQFKNPNRPELSKEQYRKRGKQLLANEFTGIPIKNIDTLLARYGYNILETFTHLDTVTATANRAAPWRELKKPRRQDKEHGRDAYERAAIRSPDETDATKWERMAVFEMGIAKKVKRALSHGRQLLLSLAEKKELKVQQDEYVEHENLEAQKRAGAMSECGCCFGEVPLNRMVHCNGPGQHAFCKDCARQQAETLIGQQRFAISCMSLDGCSAGFSINQRNLFLTPHLQRALDRLEADAALRMAGIENLAGCPFCDFAAECLPIEQDKEFRCQNAECKIVSCRMCKRETHLPKTCEEIAKEDTGYAARRKIEEAMTAALVRKCNKCAAPFIKESGCNKMVCTAAGCGSVQCYVCGQTCDGYKHFDDKGRGGKKGNCPLWDSVETRHVEEVEKAEKAAREAVAKEHPTVEAEYLGFHMSDRVKEDERRRLQNNPQHHVPRIHGGAGPPPLMRHVVIPHLPARFVDPQNIVEHAPDPILDPFLDPLLDRILPGLPLADRDWHPPLPLPILQAAPALHAAHVEAGGPALAAPAVAPAAARAPAAAAAAAAADPVPAPPARLLPPNVRRRHPAQGLDHHRVKVPQPACICGTRPGAGNPGRRPCVGMCRHGDLARIRADRVRIRQRAPDFEAMAEKERLRRLTADAEPAGNLNRQPPMRQRLHQVLMRTHSNAAAVDTGKSNYAKSDGGNDKANDNGDAFQAQQAALRLLEPPRAAVEQARQVQDMQALQARMVPAIHQPDIWLPPWPARNQLAQFGGGGLPSQRPLDMVGEAHAAALFPPLPPPLDPGALWGRPDAHMAGFPLMPGWDRPEAMFLGPPFFDANHVNQFAGFDANLPHQPGRQEG